MHLLMIATDRTIDNSGIKLSSNRRRMNDEQLWRFPVAVSFARSMNTN